MKVSVRIAVTAALLACSALATFAIVAAARTARFNSTVTIGFQRGHGQESDTFSGRVKSRHQACQAHRRIKLLQRVKGPDAPIGKTRSTRLGHWEVHLASTRSGTYYAKALRKVLRNSKVCGAEISNNLQVQHGPGGQP